MDATDFKTLKQKSAILIVDYCCFPLPLFVLASRPPLLSALRMLRSLSDFVSSYFKVSLSGCPAHLRFGLIFMTNLCVLTSSHQSLKSVDRYSAVVVDKQLSLACRTSGSLLDRTVLSFSCTAECLSPRGVHHLHF